MVSCSTWTTPGLPAWARRWLRREKVAFDFNYSYSDVYITTNACYANGANATLPGAATPTSTSGSTLCPSLLTDQGL